MRLPLACCFGLFALAALADDPRTWTSKSGRYSVHAEVVDVTDQSVRLKRAEDGKIIEVRLDQLSDGDRQYVQSLNTPAAGTPAARTQTVQPDTDPEVVVDARDPAGAAAPLDALPAPDQIGIEIVSDTQFRLIPFGAIVVPGEEMSWRIASRQPPVFIAQQGESGAEAVVLTVAPALAKQAQRQAMLKGHYNTLVQQLTGAGFQNVRGTKLDPETEVGDVVGYNLAADLPDDGGERNFITELQFGKDYTYIFQSSAPSMGRAQTLIRVAETFQPVGSQSKVAIPAEVVTGLKKRLEEIVMLLETEDTEAILRELMPPDIYQRMQSDDERWTRVVADFAGGKSAELKKALSEVDWDHAEYDADAQTVRFPVAPRSIVFKNIDGKWQMQN